MTVLRNLERKRDHLNGFSDSAQKPLNEETADGIVIPNFRWSETTRLEGALPLRIGRGNVIIHPL